MTARCPVKDSLRRNSASGRNSAGYATVVPALLASPASPAASTWRHQVARGGDRGAVGHVDAHRQPFGGGAAKGLAVLLAVDAREHVKSRGGRG